MAGCARAVVAPAGLAVPWGPVLARVIPRLLGIAIVAALAGCGAAPTLPPPPTDVTAVSVAPVVNKTKWELVTSGDFIGAKFLGVSKKTVMDVMREDTGKMLRDRGIKVDVAGAPVLKITLQHFDLNTPQLDWVDVGLTVTLTDPDGTVRWSAERSNWLVSTQLSPSMPAAYETAAHAVVRQLFEDWGTKS